MKYILYKTLFIRDIEKKDFQNFPKKLLIFEQSTEYLTPEF